MGHELTVGQPQNFHGHFIDIGRLKLRFALLEQHAEPADHLARPVIVDDDVIQNLANLGQIDDFFCQYPLRRLRVAEDRGQRLVQFMGQGAGQFPEAGDAR